MVVFPYLYQQKRSITILCYFTHGTKCKYHFILSLYLLPYIRYRGRKVTVKLTKLELDGASSCQWQRFLSLYQRARGNCELGVRVYGHIPLFVPAEWLFSLCPIGKITKYVDSARKCYLQMTVTMQLEELVEWVWLLFQTWSCYKHACNQNSRLQNIFTSSIV